MTAAQMQDSEIYGPLRKQHGGWTQLNINCIINQGSHWTGKIVKSNSRQGKHREFENFGKTQEIWKLQNDFEE